MTPLPFDDLEHIYESLAQAIDQAGPRNETVFLAKVALALAHALGDADKIDDILRNALADLPDPPQGDVDKSAIRQE